MSEGVLIGGRDREFSEECWTSAGIHGTSLDRRRALEITLPLE
jgi:hypothetical protein